MPSRHLRITILPASLGVILLALLLFWPTTTARGQCGSQASSCKNCHEVQGQDPINNDGTGWHESHAFGDFCEFCHAGNVQATAKDAAHTGLVAPLANVQASCSGCHPADLMERAGVYAAALGVEVGSGGPSSPESEQPPEAGEPPAAGDQSSGAGFGDTAIVVDQAEIVDYAQQYDQTVLGKRQINTGNLISGGLLILLTLGGGALVVWNERRLRQPSTATPEAPAVEAPSLTSLDAYPPQVLALLPQIAALNPYGLRALQRLLENPDQASELLHSLSRLDPDLVRRLRALDGDSRVLLLALASSGD